MHTFFVHNKFVASVRRHKFALEKCIFNTALWGDRRDKIA